jgi:hypothetical protein
MQGVYATMVQLWSPKREDDMVADPDAVFFSLYHPHFPRQNTYVFSLPRNNPKPSRTSSRMSQQKNFL